MCDACKRDGLQKSPGRRQQPGQAVIPCPGIRERLPVPTPPHGGVAIRRRSRQAGLAKTNGAHRRRPGCTVLCAQHSSIRDSQSRAVPLRCVTCEERKRGKDTVWVAGVAGKKALSHRRSRSSPARRASFSIESPAGTHWWAPKCRHRPPAVNELMTWTRGYLSISRLRGRWMKHCFRPTATVPFSTTALFMNHPSVQIN